VQKYFERKNAEMYLKTVIFTIIIENDLNIADADANKTLENVKESPEPIFNLIYRKYENQMGF
jgi:hypothetical protein